MIKQSPCDINNIESNYPVWNGDIDGWQELPELSLHAVLLQQSDSNLISLKTHKKGKDESINSLPNLGGNNGLKSSLSHTRKIKEIHHTVSFSQSHNEKDLCRVPQLKSSVTKFPKVKHAKNKTNLTDQPQYETKTLSMPPEGAENNEELMKLSFPEVVYSSLKPEENIDKWAFLQDKHVFVREASASGRYSKISRKSIIDEFTKARFSAGYPRVPPPTRQGLSTAEHYSSIYGELVNIKERNSAPNSSRSLSQWRAQRMIASIQIGQLCKLLPNPREITTPVSRRSKRPDTQSSLKADYLSDQSIHRADIAYSLPLASYELRQINVKRWTSLPASISAEISQPRSKKK